jgi:probable HAF family extracellular repeat protein
MGINNAGQIVGQTLANGSFSGGFVYSGGTYATFNAPLAGNGPNQGTWPLAINNLGQIAGTYVDSNGIVHAFSYNGGNFTTLPTPAGATGIEPMGINNAGQIVGQTLANGSFSGGFVYSGGTYATFNDPLAGNGPNQGTWPVAINNSGQIVGTYVDSNGIVQAFEATPVDPAPGPVVGAGLPGLIAACGGLFGWWRRKRKAEAPA